MLGKTRLIYNYVTANQGSFRVFLGIVSIFFVVELDWFSLSALNISAVWLKLHHPAGCVGGGQVTSYFF